MQKVMKWMKKMRDFILSFRVVKKIITSGKCNTVSFSLGGWWKTSCCTAYILYYILGVYMNMKNERSVLEYIKFMAKNSYGFCYSVCTLHYCKKNIVTAFPPQQFVYEYMCLHTIYLFIVDHRLHGGLWWRFLEESWWAYFAYDSAVRCRTIHAISTSIRHLEE